jgi:hypothetical protein
MEKMRFCGLFLILITLWIPRYIEAYCLPEIDVEATVSGFFPCSRKVQRIYSDAIAIYDVEAYASIFNNYHIWLGAGYLSDVGKSIGEKNPTHLHLVPVTLGLRYLHPLNSCTDFFAGAGLSWSFLRIHDHLHYVQKHIKKNALGGIFKLGFNYHLSEYIYIHLSSEYFYQQFSFKHHEHEHYTTRHHLNLSAFKVGMGLGFSF